MKYLVFCTLILISTNVGAQKPADKPKAKPVTLPLTALPALQTERPPTPPAQDRPTAQVTVRQAKPADPHVPPLRSSRPQ